MRLTTGESRRDQKSAERESAALEQNQTPEQEERKSLTNRSKRSLVDGIKSVLSEIRKSMSSQERSDKGSAKGKQEEGKSGGFALAPDSLRRGSKEGSRSPQR